ncbi:MAG: RidA family protein [Sphingorhabdus sp.]
MRKRYPATEVVSPKQGSGNHNHSRIAAGILAVSLLLTGCSKSEGDKAAFERLSPNGLADSQKLWNYSQVIAIAPGARLIEIAGTTGDDSNGNIVTPSDMTGQVNRAFENLEASLKAAGTSGKDVVRVRMYVVGLDGETHWPIINSAMRRHFGERGPTSTLVGIQTLAAPDILFEIDASAVTAKEQRLPNPGFRP